jgi:Holliday junction resolvase
LAKTPEAKVKDKIKKILKAHGVYYIMPIGSGYGNAGVPDFICCYKGFFMAIEAKASGNMATVLQAKNLEEIIDAGGVAVVVNENNLHAIEGWLKILEVKAQ